MGKIRNHLSRNFSADRTEDKLTKEKRSVLMSKIRSKGTAFEVAFFEAIRKDKIRFKKHPKGFFGNPDLILPEKNVCVFIDSGFWHGWQYPRWRHKLKNDFWRDKIERNRKRDRMVSARLRRSGYVVLRFWEHQIKKDALKCISKIKKAGG